MRATTTASCRRSHGRRTGGQGSRGTRASAPSPPRLLSVGSATSGPPSHTYRSSTRSWRKGLRRCRNNCTPRSNQSLARREERSRQGESRAIALAAESRPTMAAQRAIALAAIDPARGSPSSSCRPARCARPASLQLPGHHTAAASHEKKTPRQTLSLACQEKMADVGKSAPRHDNGTPQHEHPGHFRFPRVYPLTG
jgi:hypothetical protein